MSKLPALAAALATLAPFALAAPPNDQLDRWEQIRSLGRNSDEKPKTDAARIINESNAFLKEREPEMSSEEYALYQKMTSVLAGNPALAVKFLEGMVNEKEPPSPAFDFILGNAYYAVGENAQAEAHYRRGLDRYPTFLRAWSNLGVLYYLTERYADAVPCFMKAVNLGDREATTFGLLAYSLEQTGNAVGAETAYLQALSGAPDNVDWTQGLLRIYLDGKQYGRAEALVRTLIRSHPGDARYWLTYANILLSEHDKTKAIAVLEIAVDNNAAGIDELVLLGDLYAEQQLVPEAIAIYQKVLALQPDQGTQKLLQFAQVLIAGDKLADAELLLTRLTASATPADATLLHLVRAELYLAQRKWFDARRELDDVLRGAPLQGRALLDVGLAYLGEDDLDRAAFAFEAAARAPATAYRASIELANIELKNRHYGKAVEHLTRAYGLEKSEAVADLLAQVRTLAENEPHS